MTFDVPNASERWWFSRIKALNCLVCSRMGKKSLFVERHHIKVDGVRVSNFATIPLCQEHHTGKTGIHCEWPQKNLGVSEVALLAEAISLVAIRESLEAVPPRLPGNVASRPWQSKRRRAMSFKRLHDKGLGFAEIGRRNGISGERVRQLIRGLDEARK